MTPFLAEIHQQPQALRQLLSHLRGAGRPALEAARNLCAGRPLCFLGMGSSMYAPLAIHPALTRAGLGAEIREAGEHLHYTPDSISTDTAVIAISQSGESAETLRAVEALDAGHPVLAITNAPDSGLGQRGQVALPLCAGDEAAISTKTYSNTLAVLHVLQTALTGGDIDTECDRLARLADDMQALLEERSQEMADAAAFLDRAGFLYSVARGPALAAAHQGALTFNEGARLATCALAGGSFRHGPLEQVDESFAAVLFAPAGRTADLVFGLARDVAAAGGRVLLLTDRPPADAPPQVRSFVLPERGEDLFPLSACVPVELLLYHVARARGHEAGVFQRVTKVTRTE